jgi:Ca-activated chloride channel family protein
MVRVGLAMAAAALWLADAGQQPRSVFRAGADLVHVAVTVTDGRGAVVADLEADDFEIVEDGTLQRVTQFARSSDAGAPELHAALMLDTSESMLADLHVSQTAAIRFLNRLPEAVDFTLVDFDTEVRVGRFSQDSFPWLVERIRSRAVDGWTALYDAFGVYLEGAAENTGRTVLVAFTDGGDSRSVLKYGDVLSVVRASDVTIHVVGLLEHAPSDVKNLQRIRLTRIAEESGGRAIFPSSMKQIEAAYDRILAEMQAQYSLGYVSTNTRRDGRWRTVTVRARASGRRDLEVRARAGYYAPRDPQP